MSGRNVQERDLVKCEDMRIHAERACRFTEGMTFTQFRADQMAQDAVIRCVEVVGEAARLVSAATRERAGSIPWVSIIGTRNLLIHEYGAVDLKKIFEVVTRDLPALLAELQGVIRNLEKDVGWPGER